MEGGDDDAGRRARVVWLRQLPPLWRCVLTSVNRRGAVPEFAAPFVDLNQTAKDFVRGHVGDSCNAHAARVPFFARNFGLSVPQTWLRIIPKT